MCGEPEGRMVHREGRWGVYACGGCGHGWTLPSPTEAELAAAYADDSYYSARAMDGPASAYLKQAEALTARSLDQRSGRILDVGCGPGGLLAAMRELGWTGVGVESGEAGVRVARARGLDVRQGSWDAVDLSAERPFDLVSFVHVLEHLRDPREALSRARRRLAPSGRLLVAVPNKDAWDLRFSARARARTYDLPVHLHHFTEASLRRALEGAGFREVEIVVSVPDRLLGGVEWLAGLKPRRRSGLGPTHSRAPESEAPSSRAPRSPSARGSSGARTLAFLRRVVPGPKLTAWGRNP